LNEEKGERTAIPTPLTKIAWRKRTGYTGAQKKNGWGKNHRHVPRPEEENESLEWFGSTKKVRGTPTGSTQNPKGEQEAKGHWTEDQKGKKPSLCTPGGGVACQRKIRTKRGGGLVLGVIRKEIRWKKKKKGAHYHPSKHRQGNISGKEGFRVALHDKTTAVIADIGHKEKGRG